MSGIIKPGEGLNQPNYAERILMLEEAVKRQGQLLGFLEQVTLTLKKVFDQVKVNEPVKEAETVKDAEVVKEK